MWTPLKPEGVWGLTECWKYLDTRKDEEKEQDKEEETKEEEVKRVMRKECRELRNYLGVGEHIKVSTAWIFTVYFSQALWNNITKTGVDT